MADQFDPWRQEVSQALGRIEANITNLGERRDDHETRVKKLEEKQFRRDGVLGLVLVLLPFGPSLLDPLKKLFTG